MSRLLGTLLFCSVIAGITLLAGWSDCLICEDGSCDPGICPECTVGRCGSSIYEVILPEMDFSLLTVVSRRPAELRERNLYPDPIFEFDHPPNITG